MVKERIGATGPSDRPTPTNPDRGWSLDHSEDVKNALSEKCARVKQLEKYCEDVRSQAIREVEELKGMVREIAQEVYRLRDILIEHNINFDKHDFVETHIKRTVGP